MLGEYFVAARRDGQDESLASFARRRLGREAFERLVQPLAAGIYTADPEQLSLAATMPRFLEMERQHGGLIRAARHNNSARGAAERGALQPVRRAARRDAGAGDCRGGALPAETVRLNAPVSRLQSCSGGGWDIVLEGAAQPERFDAVILALPAHRAATPGAAAGRRARHIARGDSLRQLGRCRFGLQRFAIRKAARRFWHRRARHRESTDPGRELHERQVHAPCAGGLDDRARVSRRRGAAGIGRGQRCGGFQDRPRADAGIDWRARRAGD